MSTTTKNTFRLAELPKNVADRVVKLPKDLAGGVTTRGRGVWLAGLGALAAAEEEGAQLFTSLVRRGEKLVERGEQVEAKGRERMDGVRSDLAVRQKQVTEQVSGRVQAVETDLGETLTATLRRLGVPTRTEVQELSGKVDVLTRRVAALVDSLQATRAAEKAVFSVAAREDGWAVALAGEQDARGVYPTKDEALEAARGLAAAHAPSQLVIHRKDGSVQDTLSYEA